MTQRYQHITPEVTAAIADQVGDFVWTKKKARRAAEDSATAPAGRSE